MKRLLIFFLLPIALLAQKRGDVPLGHAAPVQIGDLGPVTHFGAFLPVKISAKSRRILFFRIGGCKNPTQMKGELTCRTYVKYPKKSHIHGTLSFVSSDPASDDDNRYRYLIIPDRTKGAWVQGRPNHTIFLEIDWRE